ncbi:hypothetical protein JN00_0543 [Metamycoplasma subdolum]|uniref:Uncharacterized protein n=1 Tax=Metamycoplasma subdolum TaxID=92407 RepID=A0A3L9ZXJ5_9BACT|nr:hypothetical protein [Metamycoplasma subdolum]RMA77433.1 hypothetical protein JN00_0543 [Metamycoplasma subdolum]WPB50338.1 hypothetical protein R9C05_01880 [Metamycoplasma subdolum]
MQIWKINKKSRTIGTIIESILIGILAILFVILAVKTSDVLTVLTSENKALINFLKLFKTSNDVEGLEEARNLAHILAIIASSALFGSLIYDITMYVIFLSTKDIELNPNSNSFQIVNNVSTKTIEYSQIKDVKVKFGSVVISLYNKFRKIKLPMEKKEKFVEELLKLKNINSIQQIS